MNKSILRDFPLKLSPQISTTSRRSCVESSSGSFGRSTNGNKSLRVIWGRGLILSKASRPFSWGIFWRMFILNNVHFRTFQEIFALFALQIQNKWWSIDVYKDFKLEIGETKLTGNFGKQFNKTINACNLSKFSLVCLSYIIYVKKIN